MRDTDAVLVSVTSLKSAPNPRILPKGSGDAHVVVNSISAPNRTEDGGVIVALGTLPKESAPNLGTLPKGVGDADAVVAALKPKRVGDADVVLAAL